MTDDLTKDDALRQAVAIALDAQLAAKRAELAELHAKLAEQHAQLAAHHEESAAALRVRMQ